MRGFMQLTGTIFEGRFSLIVQKLFNHQTCDWADGRTRGMRHLDNKGMGTGCIVSAVAQPD